MNSKCLKSLWFVSLILIMMVFGMAGFPAFVKAAASASVNSVNAEEKDGLVKENGKYYYYQGGKTVKNTWMSLRVLYKGKEKVRKYYFQSDGSACTSVIKIGNDYYCFSNLGGLFYYKTNRLVTKGKYQYCPDSSGRCQTGWLLIGKDLYYASTKGRIQKNKTIKGIVLSKTGAAVSDTASELKKKALSITAEITKPGMSKPEKLRACWNYMVSNRFRYSSMSPNLKEAGWQKKFAYNMLVTQRGSCTSFACGFAALASAVGYDPVIVYGRVPGTRDQASDGYTRHCWVKIDGKYYDPEAHFAGWMRNVYGYSSFPIRHQILKVLNFETGK